VSGGEERERRHDDDGLAAKSECDPYKCKRLAVVKKGEHLAQDESADNGDTQRTAKFPRPTPGAKSKGKRNPRAPPWVVIIMGPENAANKPGKMGVKCGTCLPTARLGPRNRS